jgi:ABC-type uncharacterized transport system permease subunit
MKNFSCEGFLSEKESSRQTWAIRASMAAILFHFISFSSAFTAANPLKASPAAG